MKKLLFFIGFGVTVLLTLAIFTAPASATLVNPDVVSDNPSCTELGYDFGFKPQLEPPPSGTYYYPDEINTVAITSDGTYFDWTSTLGVDAVIVKGGPNANVYVYDPPTEAFGDTGLHSPFTGGGQQAAISHIEFCYDYEVDVSKDAHTTFTRTFEWTIDKSVTPETWDLFTGDTGTSQYTVSVEKTGFTDSDWAVSGSILIENNTPFDAVITDVSDAISDFGPVAVNCGVTFPYTLVAGDSLSCTYATLLPNGDSRTNMATVTTSGIVGGNEAAADVTFGDPTTVVNDTINVDDTNGGSWTFSDSGSVTYERTFSCDENEGTHDNTAAIVETGQSDDASVTVNCYALEVTKNAPTSFTRTYNWTIDKWADQSALTLSIGQQFLVNYEVTVDATYTDSAWAVNGDIWVYNPAPIAAELNSVSDVVSPAIAAAVDCGVSFPYSLAAGGTLSCTYDTGLPDATSRTNTATATLQNYDYDHLMNPTANGTTDFTGTAVVDFSNATINEVDKCIDVNDSFAGFLGTVCYPNVPQTFSYSRWIGPYDVCGDYTVSNTASFVTNDTGTAGSDDWTVTVNVPCVGGCTLTPGYWKTHSKYGPAPYDDTWTLVGEDTPFFLSGQSYYEVLWTNPQGGNAYYILAHAYIAAGLNQLNGADFAAAQAAYDAATNLFNTYTPDDVAGLKGKSGKELRDQFIVLADILDDYNNGFIGPGHCSE